MCKVRCNSQESDPRTEIAAWEGLASRVESKENPRKALRTNHPTLGKKTGTDCILASRVDDKMNAPLGGGTGDEYQC